MQPLKLTIEGAFWDSFLYAGRLYLFHDDGSVRGIEWDRLLEALALPETHHLAFRCAFLQSDYLYSPDVHLIFGDGDFRELLANKFRALSETPLHIDHAALNRLTTSHQQSKLPFPHTDITIYNSQLYAASMSGIWQARVGRGLKNFISTRTHRIWDAATHAISASYGTVAAAAGDEGLYEIPVNEQRFPDPAPTLAAQDHCTDVDWCFHSLFGTSHVGGGFLCDYDKQAIDHHYKRIPKGTLSATTLFDDHGYCWALNEKLYCLTDTSLLTLRYDPRPDHAHLTHLKPVRVNLSSPISAKTTPVGVIIERDRSLAILLSNGGRHDIEGDIVNWRTFPRSKHYINQLHVIEDESLSVYSYNHDYFLDQRKKTIGASSEWLLPRDRRFRR